MSKPKKKRDKKMTGRWSKPFLPAMIARADSDRIEHSYNDALAEQALAHKQFQELREGRGNYDGWCDLAARINLGAVLARSYEFNEGDPAETMNGGIEALAAVYERCKVHGSYVMKGEEMRALGDALNTVDALWEATTRRQHLVAMRMVIAQAAF